MPFYRQFPGIVLSSSNFSVMIAYCVELGKQLSIFKPYIYIFGKMQLEFY